MEIDELVYEHNKRMAIEALYDDEMAMVDSYTRAHEITAQNEENK